MTVTIRDRGANDLVKKATKPRNRGVVRVGIIGAKAGAEHGEGLTVAEVGEFHEFGLGHNPRRSFIAGYVDDNRKRIEGKLRQMMKMVIKEEVTIPKALEMFGLKATAEIQERMAEGISGDPDGAPRTLIDTGQLRSSITSEVEQ